MILRHSQYIDFMRQLAQAHVDIGHSEEEMHFARITLTQDPYVGAMAQIREFVNSMGSKLKYPCLVAISFKANYADTKNDDPRKQNDGGFLLLDQVKTGDADAEQQVYDNMERIGEEIIAYIREYFEENEDEGIFNLNNVESEKVAKVGNTQLFGIKFYLTIEGSVALFHNPDKWNDTINLPAGSGIVQLQWNEDIVQSASPGDVIRIVSEFKALEIKII
ncbi:MAG: hypothetical protein AAGF85_00710 [Bacteroidota bacterium]